MTKSDVIASVAEKAGGSKEDAKTYVDAFIDVIKESLKEGEKIQLIGLGTFEVSERAARTGINPQTKETIEIPAAKSPKFKAGKAFKDMINE